MGSKLTLKSDIYSFGIVLLEVSSLPPVTKRPAQCLLVVRPPSMVYGQHNRPELTATMSLIPHLQPQCGASEVNSITGCADRDGHHAGDARPSVATIVPRGLPRRHLRADQGLHRSRPGGPPHRQGVLRTHQGNYMASTAPHLCVRFCQVATESASMMDGCGRCEHIFDAHPFRGRCAIL